MLSYSSCSEFYKCPFKFQHRYDMIETSTALTLGSNIDTMINALLVGQIRDEKLREQKAIQLGFSDMLNGMVNGGNLCKLMDVPMMVKQWYTDFIESGLEVLDVQKHFIIDELDYHGYIDAIFWDGYKKIVVENKTTSRFYEKYFSAKKESYQVVGYAIAEDTDTAMYYFFNTKNMAECHPIPRKITNEDKDEFTEWVKFVKNNEHSFVKNREWCSLMGCNVKEECYEESTNT